MERIAARPMDDAAKPATRESNGSHSRAARSAFSTGTEWDRAAACPATLLRRRQLRHRQSSDKAGRSLMWRKPVCLVFKRNLKMQTLRQIPTILTWTRICSCRLAVAFVFGRRRSFRFGRIGVGGTCCRLGRVIIHIPACAFELERRSRQRALQHALAPGNSDSGVALKLCIFSN